MTVTDVTASGSYQVLVGSGILTRLHKLLGSVTKAKRAVIVSDSNVFPLYGAQVTDQVERSGIVCGEPFVFPAGEESKSGATYLALLNHLAANQITRSDCLIALGGGVTGDLTGFAAATFLRGVDYIQLPTTLLAAVDSSVGGKTAIDLDAGKNLAGAFYQPRLVLCDTDTLRTLPEEIFLDGCAEVIKYGVLYDRSLFDLLSDSGPDFPLEAVITRCVALKRDVVNADEFDRGQRQKLNLGHTLGHGVEAQSDFKISHGKAVAIGMAMVSRAGAAYGITQPETVSAIEAVLERFHLPTRSPFDAESIYTSALSDKKRSGGSVNLIIPRAIGDCIISSTDIQELLSFIKAGM